MSGTPRRAFLSGVGGLVIAFTLRCSSPAAREDVHAFLDIDRDGNVTVKFGKVELGTGISTAIAQIVADELDVPVANVRVPSARTVGVPDQGQTVGSDSLSSSLWRRRTSTCPSSSYEQRMEAPR